MALAECCISGERQIGASVHFRNWSGRPDKLLFNESQSRIVLSAGPAHAAAIEAACAAAMVPFFRIGEVGGSELIVTAQRETLRWEIAELYEAWYFAVERAMNR